MIYRCPICDKSLAYLVDTCIHQVGKYNVYIYRYDRIVVYELPLYKEVLILNETTALSEDRIEKLLLLK